MRLRKNMKRTAAVVLALSMAVSAVAAPASAAYICDVSQGNVEISRDGSYTSITVGGKKVNDNGDGTNDIIIIGDNTGDNTKPTATESLNAEEENTSEVEKSGENTSEVEKSGETEEQAQEPGSLELLAPEDEEKQAQQKETEEKPADSQEPEQDEKSEKTSDQVIEYGQYDPEAQQEAAKPAPKPAAEQKAEEKKPAEEKTYEATNAPTTLSEGVQAAANNVVSIINNSANALKVILRNLKVDAGDATQNAMTIKGKGNVTLELDGKNELTGGTGCRQPSVYRGSGLDSYDQTGTLTITDEDKNGSLTAVGGDVVGVVSNSWYGGNGIYANNLTISGATVTAVGGGADDRGSNEVSQNGSKGGYGINAKGNVKFSNATVTATGGSAFSDKTSVEGGNGLNIISNGEFIIDSGTNLTATGGSAESKTGYVEGGQGLYLGGDLKKMTVNGATVTLAGGNAKTNSTGYSSEAGVGMGTYSAKDTEITNSKVTVIGGDRTGGRTEKARAVKITIGSKDSFKLNGDTTFTGIGIIQTTVGKITVAGDATLVKEDCKYEYAKIEPEENGKIYTLGDITVTENEDGTKTISGTLTGKKVAGHDYKVVSIEEPTCTTPGKRVYTCTTEGHEGETYEETIDALGHDFVDGVCNRCGAPEQAAAENGGSSAVTLTVTGAGAYETSIADGRYVVAVPAETAVLSGCLGNLKELKAQGVNTLVFRTQLRETVLNIDSMLSLGVDDTLFTLTHNGEGASLTIGGFEHNELIH